MTSRIICHMRRCPVASLRLSAFTLVELLVVIAIISLLIAILLPALSSARARAKQVQCLAQQRQLSVGFISYSHDSKGWFGTVAYSTPWLFYEDAQSWDAYLGTTTKLMTCPDARPQFLKSAAFKAGATSGGFVASSYVIPAGQGTHPTVSHNIWFFGWLASGWVSTPERPAATIPNERYTNGVYKSTVKTMYIPAPSVQPMFADGYNPSGAWGIATMSFYYNSHPSSTNIAFVDGHAVMRANDEMEHRYKTMWW